MAEFRACGDVRGSGGPRVHAVREDGVVQNRSGGLNRLVSTSTTCGNPS
jgi:hypothetical protein